MALLFVAILTGLAWMGLINQVSWGSFLFGAAAGLVVWRYEGARSRRPFGPLRFALALGLGLRIFAVFLWELVVANLEQLRIVLAPRIAVRPGWVRFRSELETPALRALLGAMVSLTPGTLTYEESEDESGSWSMSLHVLDLGDEEALVAHLRERFEAPLRRLEEL